MLVHVPRLVTIEVGSSPGSLCAEEILSVINEIADLTVGSARFVLHDHEAIDTLVRVAEHAQYRDVNAIISLPRGDERALRAAASIAPAAIALPLQSHCEMLHDAIAGDCCTWRETAAFAAIARHEGIAVELETRVVSANAYELVTIAGVATALHASRWRVDFSLVKPHPSATSVILGVAGRGALAITVHALPQLRLALLQQMTGDFRVPDLRRLSSIDRAESVHIAHDGAVVIPGRANEIAGSVRRQTVAGIFNGSETYARLRAPRRLTPPPQLARRSRFSTSMARG